MLYGCNMSEIELFGSKWSKKSSLLIGIALCCYVTFVFLKIRLSDNGSILGMKKYVYCYHLINYQVFGLCPRGLIGTFLRPVLPHLSERIHTYIFCAIPLLFSYLLCLRYAFALGENVKNRVFLILLGGCTISFPPTFIPFHDIGRYDMFCLWLLFICAYCFPRLPRFAPVLLCISSVICIFMHEAALFLFIPGIVSLYLISIDDIKKRDILYIVLNCILLLTSLWILNASKQNLQTVSMKEYLHEADIFHLLKDGDGLIDDYTNRSQFGAIIFGLRVTLKKHLYIQFIFLIPYYYFIFHLWKLIVKHIPEQKIKILFCIICCQIPVFMTLLGSEFCRWFSALSFCNFFPLFLFAFRFKNEIHIDKRLGMKFLLICVLYLTLGLPLAYTRTTQYFTDYTRKFDLAAVRVIKGVRKIVIMP